LLAAARIKTMKIRLPKKFNNKEKSFHDQPPIPLEREDQTDITKDNSITIKLKSNPTDENSGTYELTVAYFRDGTPEQFFKLEDNLQHIFQGQNLTTGPILQDEALAVFNCRLNELNANTAARCNAALDALRAHVSPNRALAQQKCYMRR
jgi:hypothetical protein